VELVPVSLNISCDLKEELWFVELVEGKHYRKTPWWNRNL